MDTCKHNWHPIEGTERLRCQRCKVETGPKTPEERTQDMLKDIATIGSAWSKNGERIDPVSVYKDFEPWTKEQLSVPAGQTLSFGPIKPNYNITFHRVVDGRNGDVVGRMDFNGPEFVFEGDAAESAKVFIDWIARSFHGRLKDEREAGRKEAKHSKPDAWGVTWDGELTGNIFPSKELADMCRQNLDAKYEAADRQVVAIYMEKP